MKHFRENSKTIPIMKSAVVFGFGIFAVGLFVNNQKTIKPKQRSNQKKLCRMFFRTTS